MNIELLAPAGTYESLQAALNAGADAVYLGGSRFGARAYAGNFQEEELLRVIDECHVRGKKLYLTVNTLLKNSEMQELYAYLHPYYLHGLDGVIVQDMGVLTFIKKYFPKLPVHVSTQMSVTDSGGMEFLKEQGASRIVLARELSLKEIGQIHKESDLEIEAFVHGALCYCYSGKCLYSSLIGGRSGNRGRCAQPCRLPYEVYLDGKRVSEKAEPYLLSPKDICTLELIPEMIQAGITSFKIEGRMKNPAYTAGVVSMYRKYIDLYERVGEKGFSVEEEDIRKLMDLFNRGGFTKGYYKARNGKEMLSLQRPNHMGTKAAMVQRVSKSTVCLKALERLGVGDVLEAPEQKDDFKLEFTLKENVEKGKEFVLKKHVNAKVYEQGVFLRTRNANLLKNIEEHVLQGKFQEKINGKLILMPENPAILSLTMSQYRIEVRGAVVQRADTRPLALEKVQGQMQKTGNSPFVFDKLEIQMGADVFMPLSGLNELRRMGMDALVLEIKQSFYRKEELSVPETEGDKEETEDTLDSDLCVMLESLEAVADICSYKEVSDIYVDCMAFSSREAFLNSHKLIESCHNHQKKCYYAMPYIFRQDAKQYYQGEGFEMLQQFDGILFRNIETYQFLKEWNFQKDYIADSNIYIFNEETKQFWLNQQVSCVTVPQELNVRELRTLGCKNTELVVYGKIPVMVTAQCMAATIKGCRKRSALYELKDRKNKRFQVKNICDFCYNVIYNSAPQHLLENQEEVQRLHPKRLRLWFTTESIQEIRTITEAYIKVFYKGKDASVSLPDFTRGHFKRGVE